MKSRASKDDPPTPEAPEPEDDDGLMPWVQLSILATQAYDDYSSGNDQKAHATLRSLKAELKKWADAKPAKTKEAL